MGASLSTVRASTARAKSSPREAVQVAATGRSFRARHDVEMITLGEEWARVRAGVERRGRAGEIDIALRREEGTEPPRASREIRVNGVPVRRGDLFWHPPLVLAPPRDPQGG